MSVIKARTARAPHMCENCHWVPSLRGAPTIAPGHRYLLHTAFPGDDGFDSLKRPSSVKECISCAAERDDTAPLLDAGACGTFCCGTTPCALPFVPSGRPEHEHSCRRCAEPTTQPPTTRTEQP